MSTENEHTHEDHTQGGVYVKTLMALLILTIITVGASYIDFGSGNIVIALFIATVKASIVALFFMHLRHERPVNAVIALAGFLFLGIFLMFCFMDQDTRKDPGPLNMPQPALNLPPRAPAAAAPNASSMPLAPSSTPLPGEKH